MTLPATYLEAAAMAHARSALATVRAANPLEIGDPFDTEAMHLLVRRTLKELADWHPRNAARVLELAIHGMEQADLALKDLIAERNERGEPLSPALVTYTNILGNHPPSYRRPRSRPPSNFLANFIVCVLILDLRLQFPELGLRRSSSRRPSACSIVAAVLIEAGIGRGGEEAIRKIWERYGPPVVPYWVKK
jgi:hypothetical protein